MERKFTAPKGLYIYIWWRGEDLNLRRRRRQIYSLFPLTTREPLHTNKSQKTENKSQKKSASWLLVSGFKLELTMGLEPATP